MLEAYLLREEYFPHLIIARKGPAECLEVDGRAMRARKRRMSSTTAADHAAAPSLLAVALLS